MSGTVPPPADCAVPFWRPRLARALHAALEGVVLLLVCFAPWPFGSVHPFFEFVLFAGVAVLLVLWSLSVLVAGRFTWKRCPVALCLAGLIFLGALQLVPLPAGTLRVLSPSGVRLLQELKPAAAEQLTSGEPCELPPHVAGTTLSLYPGGTRLAVLRLLAVFLLFAVVRNTIASKESLRRLGIACLLNGTALALFALLQFFATPQRHIIFWSYETGNTVFGPFINRNDFAYFVNICLCLTGGLVAGYRIGGRGERPWSDALRHTPSLWLGTCLLLMFASMAFCLSRGGLLALFCGCLTAVCVRVASASRRSWQMPVVAAVVLALVGGIVWYVLPRAEPRLAQLWHNNAADARPAVWANALAIARDYPVFGCGDGTFGFLELGYRTGGDDPRLVFPHANNDYLEALAEGGVLRLLVSVAAVVFMFRLAVRAYRRYRLHPAGGWVLGATAAFTTVAVHSFFDFGLHIPSIAFLTAVLAAQLAALGARRTPTNQQEEYQFRLLGFGPLLAAAGLLLLAATLASEGWRLSQAERFRKAAEYRTLTRPEDSRAPQVAYLETAVRYAPDDAALRLALAEAHLWRAFQRRQEFRPLSAAAGAMAATWLEQADERREGKQRAAAVQQLLAARDLCPVMLQPHERLAELTDQLSSADAATVYLKRATLLRPTEPQLWLLRGNAEQAAGDQEAAWQSWRRSLELSDRFLPQILERLGDKADAQAVVERLLPNNPELMVQTAKLLYPDAEQATLREPLLRRALELLQQQPGSQAKTLHIRGCLQADLGDRTAAIESYRLALNRNGTQTEWRYELADLLYRDGKPKEAEQELFQVLRENPKHEKAKALQETLERDLQ